MCFAVVPECETSTVCGKQVGRRKLDSKTERSLRCLLAKATSRIKYNYNYIQSPTFQSKILPRPITKQLLLFFSKFLIPTRSIFLDFLSMFVLKLCLQLYKFAFLHIFFY